MNYHRTRYVGGPKMDTPTTAERADALRERMAQLRNQVPVTVTAAASREHDDIFNPYDFDDSERY